MEELVNISEPADSRREETRSRTLKLLLTDGLQTFAGLEVRGIKDLNVNSPAGIKVLCENFQMQRGIALFGPDSLKVVGGMVADLERSRLERIERMECAKKRRQLVPVMPPPAPDGEQSQQLPLSRPVQGADGGAMQNGSIHDEPAAPRSASNAQPNEAPRRVSGHRGASPFAGAPVRLGAPHSSGPAELPSSRHAQQDPEMSMASHALLPGGIRIIPRVMAAPGPDVAMIDIDLDEQAPEAAPSPQPPLQPLRPAGGERCSLGYLRQLLMQPPAAGGTGASAGRRVWVQAVVMGVEKFECIMAAGGYSLRLVLVDGTSRVMAQVGDAVVEGLIGMPSAVYAQYDRRQTKALRAQLSSVLSRLEGRFHLTPFVEPNGDGDGGEVPLIEVLEIDSGKCIGIARALAERVDRALVGLTE